MFGTHDVLETHAAFRYQLEKHNNLSDSSFILDMYEKVLDISDSVHVTRAGHYLYLSLFSIIDKLISYLVK